MNLPKDVIQNTILPYLDIETIQTMLQIHSFHFKWEDVPFHESYIHYFYQKFTHQIGLEEINSEYNHRIASILYKICMNDNKNECKKQFIYNVLFEFIALGMLDEIKKWIHKYDLDISIFGLRCILLSIQKHQHDVFDYFFEHFTNKENIHKQFYYHSCIYKNLYAFEKCLSHFIPSDLSFSVLFQLSCSKGSKKITDFLIEKNYIWIYELQPNQFLTWIISSKNKYFVEYMIKKYRLKPSSINQQPIYKACENNLVDVVLYLLEFPQVNPSLHQNECLKIACKKNYIQIVEILLEDERVNPYDENYVCFILCCRYGYLTILKMLVEWNPNIVLDFHDNLLHHIAYEYGNHHILHFLEDHKNKRR